MVWPLLRLQPPSIFSNAQATPQATFLPPSSLPLYLMLLID